MEDENDEEIRDVGPWFWPVVCLIIGLVLGWYGTWFYTDNIHYRSPGELADYFEEFLFEEKHQEDIKHNVLRNLLDTDSTSLGEMKRYYTEYKTSGARMMLETQLNSICYKGEWKDENDG